jgi:hypothetical protein
MSHNRIGPWHVCEFGENNGRPAVLAIKQGALTLAHVGCIPCTVKDERNARLMASAPDLLEVLEEIVSITDRHHHAWHRAHEIIGSVRGEQ